LYDFNELNSLSLVDLEFMLISCCNATYKINEMTDEVSEDEIV
jgi:microtubule-associated protein-like 5